MDHEAKQPIAAPHTMVRRICSTPFLAAVVLLGATAVLAGPMAAWFQLIRHKEALELLRPLQTMDRDGLGPYRVSQVDILRPEELEALGTEHVISWWLEDTRADQSGRRQRAHLLVTYDTGTPSLVPHTPDRCFMAQGYQPAQPHEYREITPAGLPGGIQSIPVRLLTFQKTDIFAKDRPTVVYTFFCNGEFTASRFRVRALTSDPRSRYAFFSKVEVAFPGAERDETLRLAEDLFQHVLPVLLTQHWPDFAEAEARRDNPRK